MSHTRDDCKKLGIQNCSLCEASVHRDQANDQELVTNVELWYPRSANNITTIYVGLVDVRASDGIRISYDFDRDGYVIKQSSVFGWDSTIPAEECHEDWQEVAFIKSWARERPRNP